jgi:NAD(P)-dependent dehydrogenase (short-subunit alcohol dehydrogenase family)
MITRRELLIVSSLVPFLARFSLASAESDDATPAALRQWKLCAQSTADEVTEGLDLTGKTALITGVNAGIGYETMRALVARGAHVYGLARNIDKAAAACAKATGNVVKGKATPFACEHTDFSSVAACADSVQELARPIDMLICNAGVYFLPKLEQVNGLEGHFVINHLSHFILVNRLLDLVRSAPQGRVVVVGSIAYKAALAGIEFDNLSGQQDYDPVRMYGQSKLANGLFVLELSHRLLGTRTTANVVHPGWVMTQTMHTWLQTQSFNSTMEKAKTPEQGAATLCYAATNPALEKISGQYFEDCSMANPGGHMRDRAMAARLWTISEELTRPYLTHSPA